MSLPSSPPLRLEVGRASYQRAASLFALASVASVPWLVLMPLLPLAWLVLGGSLGVSLVVTGLMHVGWLGERHWQHAVWHDDGRWTLTDRAGREHTAFLSPGTRVTRHFVRLCWSTDHRCLLLGPCDVPAVTWRRLGVRLRLQRDWTQAEMAYRFPESVRP